MIKRLALAVLLCISCYAAAASPLLRGGMGIVASCIYNGNNIGSCLIGTDTTHTLNAPDPVFTGSTVTIGFTNSPVDAMTRNGSLLYNGDCQGQIGTTAGQTPNLCYTATQIIACQTGGVAPNPPYYDQGFISWGGVGGTVYNSEKDGTTWVTSVPPYSPVYTFNDTAGSIARNYYGKTSLMTSVCGSPTFSDFVNSVAGNMPDLRSALATLQTGESVEIKASPSPIPFWPSSDNIVGAGSINSPPHDITVNFDAGVSIGYAATSKGVLDVINNGTTINGNGVSIFWVQPGNNQACVPWDSGLDLTVNDLNCNMAGMGIFRAAIRSGTTTFTNLKLENLGCQDNGCGYGKNHDLYLGSVDGNAGFDVFNGTNLFNTDVQARGWEAKIRVPNSNLTQSAFISRVNNGASSPHASIDYPCGGTHSVTFSAIENNAYSHSTSGNQSNFLVRADEEDGTNVTTVGTGSAPNISQNCPTRVWLPTGAPLTGTVTGQNTFTTTTDPATVFPYQVFGQGYGSAWDLGASGLMVNGPAPIDHWTGPDGGGLYTVVVGAFGDCFNGEGTLPLNQGVGIYACFTASSGTVTLYPQNAITVSTNTSTTASLSTPVNPILFGINVGDTIFDKSLNSTSITSITGTGPYTINLSCGVPVGGVNTCLDPSQWQQISGPALPSSVDFIMKGGPVQVTASTTGTGCTTSVICGIAFNPIAWQISPGMHIYGADVGAACVIAGQIGFVAPWTGTGTGYTTGDHITLAGGAFVTPAVLAVASAPGGVPTAYTVVSGGVYTALPKTFTQASTTGSGTGAQMHYPLPLDIFGGSGSNFTIMLAQPSGANCITGSTTNALYQVLTPTQITFDHDLVIWDGANPFAQLSSVLQYNGALASSPPNAFQSSVASNGLYVADAANGTDWSTTAPGLQIGSTDGGGNIKCHNRTDLTTSPRCAIPAFTAASFTGAITNGVMTAASGASACKPGMFIWDNEGEFNSGFPNFTVPGTRIISGGPTSFALSFPPGGANTTDVTSTSLNCGWGTPSSAENATIANDGIMTINSGLVGSIHVNDYLADISATLPGNVQVTSAIDSTHWQTNYSGAGVSAEYMVSVR